MLCKYDSFKILRHGDTADLFVSQCWTESFVRYFNDNVMYSENIPCTSIYSGQNKRIHTGNCKYVRNEQKQLYM